MTSDEFKDKKAPPPAVVMAEILKMKNFTKSTLVRFSLSLQDLSLSPTNIHYIDSTTFSLKKTPLDKYSKQLLLDAEQFHMQDLIQNDNLYHNTKQLISEIEPLLPSTSRYNLLKTLVSRSLLKVKEMIKIIHKNARDDVEN